MKKIILIGLIFFMFGMIGSADAIPVSGGLLGEYYAGAEYGLPVWDDFKYEQIDSTINFNWGGGSPDYSMLGNDLFSIKWTGWISAPTDNTYYFQLLSDDGSMLYIDGGLVIDYSGNHGSYTKEGSIYLEEGLHQLELTYHEYRGSAIVKLLWDEPHTGVYEIIGSSYLYHDDGTTSVPEPATMTLFGIGILTLFGIKRKIER